MRKTKIICTLGPATNSEEVLREIMLGGMNVARFNFSHGTHEEHMQRYSQVEKLRKELNLPIGTLLDTKGPEIRVGIIKDDKIFVKNGDKITLTVDDVLGDNEKISVSYKDITKDIKDGDRVLIDDGLIEMIALSHDATNIHCLIKNDGIISTRKGVNIPGIRLSMPYLSQKDKDDIEFGVKTGFDFIAASFVRTADDVEEVKKFISSLPYENTIRIIAKIENREGVDNVDEIIRVSGGVMIARGDMGVEIDFEDIPALQKKIIKKAYNAGKQVITATQMLDSMMKNPRPTRAETTDVANAIYDGTSAIMLSGETAAGLYPVEALKTMANIAVRTERDIDYIKRFNQRDITELPDITSAISHATVTTAMDLSAAGIVTVTKTGQTARMISKYRPNSPIIGCTTSETVCRQLNLSWGVTPIMVEEKYTNDELFDHAVEQVIENNLAKSGDLLVITAGVPLGISGTTNIMKVHIVGDVLMNGCGITNFCASARLCVCQTEEQAFKQCKEGDILVIRKTSNELMSVIKMASGIIVETDDKNCHTAIVGMALGKPVLIGAKDATHILRTGTFVTLDANRGVVCNMEKREK